MRKVSKWLKDSPRTQDILLGMHKFFIVKFLIVNNYTMGENYGITIKSLSKTDTFNPLSPYGDQHQYSPNNIHT